MTSFGYVIPCPLTLLHLLPSVLMYALYDHIFSVWQWWSLFIFKMFIFASEIGIRLLSEVGTLVLWWNIYSLPRNFRSTIYCACTATWKIFICILGLLLNRTEVTYIRSYREHCAKYARAWVFTDPYFPVFYAVWSF